MTEKQSRNRSKIFYWLGGIILICLLALGGQYLYWKYFKRDKNIHHRNYALVKPNEEAKAAINDYLKWTDTIGSNTMSLDHKLTKTGLKKIANILRLMTDSASSFVPEVPRAVDQIAKTADSLTYNRKSGNHADMIKKSFLLTIDVLNSLQNSGYESMRQQIALLKIKANKIDVKTLTLDQRGDIKSVFRQTGVTFRKLID